MWLCICFFFTWMYIYICSHLGWWHPSRGSDPNSHGLSDRQPSVLSDGWCAGHQDDRLHGQAGEVHQLWGGQALPWPLLDRGPSKHISPQSTGDYSHSVCRFSSFTFTSQVQKCLTDLMDNCQQFCKARSNQVELEICLKLVLGAHFVLTVFLRHHIAKSHLSCFH